MFKVTKILGVLFLLPHYLVECNAFFNVGSPGPVLNPILDAYSRQQHFSFIDDFFNEIDISIKSLKELFKIYSPYSDKDFILKAYSDVIFNLAKQDQMRSLQMFNITENDILAKRLYKSSEEEPAVWLSSIEAQFHRITTKKKLIDVTEHQNNTHSFVKKSKIPSVPKHKVYAEPFLESMDVNEMKEFLTKFSTFYNRYYNSHYGVESSHFLFDSLKKVLLENRRDDVTVEFFPHDWKQNSIIVRFKGSNKKTDEMVVIGAHQDSVNKWIPWFGRAPGADDDGSGTTSTFTAFQSLIRGGFKPNRTLEFHWYSGEEGGLKGSGDIAARYSEQGKNVIAMIQFDMSGHFVGSERIAVVQDYTDPELSEFLRKLIIVYSDLKWVNSNCGYGCSDHASWDFFGFRTAFPIEDPDIESNHNIHTSDDLVQTIDFHHVEQFSRLAVGFAIELTL